MGLEWANGGGGGEGTVEDEVWVHADEEAGKGLSCCWGGGWREGCAGWSDGRGRGCGGYVLPQYDEELDGALLGHQSTALLVIGEVE